VERGVQRRKDRRRGDWKRGRIQLLVVPPGWEAGMVENSVEYKVGSLVGSLVEESVQEAVEGEMMRGPEVDRVGNRFAAPSCTQFVVEYRRGLFALAIPAQVLEVGEGWAVFAVAFLDER